MEQLYRREISLQFYVLIFFVGIIASQKINVFGEIYLGEAFSFFVLILNLKKIQFPIWLRTLFFLAIIWMCSQFISDVLNNTEIIKSIKGILVPVFVILIILGHQTFFIKRFKMLPVYLLGVFSGILLNKIFLGSQFFLENPWKWGLGLSFALCFFTWIEFYCYKFRNSILFITAFIFLIISFAHSSRSLAILVVMACLIPIYSSKIIKSKLYLNISQTRLGIFSYFFVSFFLVFVLDRALGALFSFQPFLDVLPPLDAIKYSLQANNKWGIILGGRSELLVSLEAFIDSPFWGHGSWAEDPFYVYSYLDHLDSAGGLILGLETAENNLRSFLIPTHSYLMGAIVWGGIFAGGFWLFVFRNVFLGLLNSRIICSPLLLYISFSLLWNILFSPFGADARWLTSLILWLYLLLIQKNIQGTVQ